MDNFIPLNDDYMMPYGSSYQQQDGNKGTAHTFGNSWALISEPDTEHTSVPLGKQVIMLSAVPGMFSFGQVMCGCWAAKVKME